MIVAEQLAIGQIQWILSGLARGQVLRFALHDGGPLAFTIERRDHAYVARDQYGYVLRTCSTFAEVWRDRPRG